MQTTPIRSGNRGDTLADGLDQRLQVLERTSWQHAVAEVEDMARAPGRPFEDVAHPLDHEPARAEQHRRIEVALHPELVADTPPGGVEVDAPVERDDIGARGCDQLEQPRGGGSEVDP